MGTVHPFRKKKKKKKNRVRGPKDRVPSTKHVWQAALIRMPTWVEGDDDGQPYRPWTALALSLTHDLIGGTDLVGPDEKHPSLVVSALLRLAETCGEWPDVIEVRDPELIQTLEAIPELTGAEIIHRDRLAALDDVVIALSQATGGDEGGLPSATTVPGVTVENLRSFAEASQRFFDAEPWREMDDEDFIRVESPIPDPTLRHISVMGAAGQEFGLIFMERLGDFLEMNETDGPEFLRNRSLWSVSPSEPHEVDFREHDLWEAEGLPFVMDTLIPTAVAYGPKHRLRRASPKLLSFFESILIALVETTVDDLDSGSWQREVETSAGRVTVAFSLVDPWDDAGQGDELAGMPPRTIMERTQRRAARLAQETGASTPKELEGILMRANEMESGAAPAVDPREAAQGLAYEAMETHGRRRRSLARQALELSPDCVDALGILAEDEPDLNRSIGLFEAAVAAGEKELGPEAFDNHVGHFWGLVETRPYMRARASLAQCLWSAGRHGEAIAHYCDLLRLNPNDNQGVRSFLVSALIEINDLDSAQQLLTNFKETYSAAWHYSWALVTLLREGDGRLARRRLTDAFKCNPHLPDLLLEREPLPPSPPEYYKPGDITEAVVVAFNLAHLWRKVPEAMAWLEGRWDRHTGS